MNLFGLIPETEDSRLRNRVETEISGWLMDSEFDADAKLLRRLSDMGIRGKFALTSLAQIKSLQKYKYPLKPESLHYILDLADAQPILQKFLQGRPYLLAKAAMIYEHAPTFLLGRNASQETLDMCLLDFATNYIAKFWEYSSHPQAMPLHSPRRVFRATFWDSEFWHPAAYVEKAYQDNLAGVEYYIDFHPFNLNKLLPEDFSTTHRSLIREWVERMKIQLSIHSAIVGPSSTSDYMGKQLFYDSTEISDLQKETVLLAKDIGASSVILHLVDPGRLSELAEIIETASDSNVRVTLENYYYTEKINQTSEQFIAVLDSLVPLLTKRTRERNFGVTFDPGHYNIEGEDPVIAALRVGKWCKEKALDLTKVHATTNYGPLRCFPPNFSSDVHDRVSSFGINNPLIIQILRSIGHRPSVTAEQIQPLIERDIALIDDAQQSLPEQDYEAIVQKGKELLAAESDSLITPDIRKTEAYQFIAGLSGVRGLQEYLVYRKIQNTERMTAETAKATTLVMMNASIENQRQAVAHVERVLHTAIEAEGGVSQNSIAPICERLSDALITEMHREYLNVIFAENVEYQSGETICDEGMMGDEMFFVKGGCAGVSIANQQIATLEAGEIFGEISLFYGVPRSATVKATTNGTTIGILKKESLFSALLDENKDSAKAVLLQLCRILPERLRKLNARYAQALKILQGLNPSYSNPPSDDAIDELAEFDVSFENLVSEEVETLFDKNQFYPPGETVFHEDAYADGVYLVKSGSVRIVRYDLQFQRFKPFEMMAQEELEKISGRDQFYIPDQQVPRESIQLARLERGSIFGEMALIDESGRSATVLSDGATLGYLSKGDFDRIMKMDANLSFNFMFALCSTIMSRIRQLDQAYLQVSSEIRRYGE